MSPETELTSAMYGLQPKFVLGCSNELGSSCDPGNLTFCLVLHGVAPSTWPLYRPLVNGLDSLGGIPVTFLVPPPPEGEAPFLAAMDGRLLRGDELVVYGYRQPGGHREDDSAAARAPHRAGHPDSASLPELQARTLLREAVRRFIELDWPVRGFVAPGWSLGEGARAALQVLPFLYTTDSDGLVRLSDGAQIPAPVLVRRDVTGVGQPGHGRQGQSLPPMLARALSCIRLAVHPTDMQHPDGPRSWLRIAEGLLNERQAITLCDRLELAEV
jgi:predicted deacetylase